MSRLLRAGTDGFAEIIIPEPPLDAAAAAAVLDRQIAADRVAASARYLRARYAALVSPSPWEHVLRHAGGRWY